MRSGHIPMALDFSNKALVILVRSKDRALSEFLSKHSSLRLLFLRGVALTPSLRDAMGVAPEWGADGDPLVLVLTGERVRLAVVAFFEGGAWVGPWEKELRVLRLLETEAGIRVPSWDM